MIIDKVKLYNLVYDLLLPVSFFGFIGILVATGITKNENIFIIGSVVLITIEVIGMFYLFFSWNMIKFWLKTKLKYKLTNNERILWNNIIQKAQIGYNEWWDSTKGNDMCGPWIKDYTEEENNLLDKIHKYFYGDGWYVSMPISCAQVNYVMYEDIKNKVK